MYSRRGLTRLREFKHGCYMPFQLAPLTMHHLAARSSICCFAERDVQTLKLRLSPAQTAVNCVRVLCHHPSLALSVPQHLSGHQLFTAHMLSALCDSWECTARLFRVVLFTLFIRGLMPLAGVRLRRHSNFSIYARWEKGGGGGEGREPAVVLHDLLRSMCVLRRTQLVSRSPPPYGVCL